ncbi:MAG: DUF4139 domain-containing protein [Burkholderiales bacterium]|nr:DUF4139 domain-containing protein [Burkholderiales bacterium]
MNTYQWIISACMAASCLADGHARITHVTLYPDAADIERTTHVAAGATFAEFTCLPGRIDAQSLRAEADSGIRLGDVSIVPLPADRADECRQGPLADKIKGLEERRAELEAQRDANNLASDYLKGLVAPSSGKTEVKTVTVPDGRTVQEVANTLRKNGQDVFLTARRLTRQIADLDKELAPLRAERDRVANPKQGLHAVRVAVNATHAGDLRLDYLVSGAGWGPGYRASLDTVKTTLVLERQAVVYQSTGEDWAAVRLTLATSRPQRSPQAPAPSPWQIDVMRPMPQGAFAAAPPPPLVAPAMARAERMDTANEPAAALPVTAIIDAPFDTRFEVPGTADLAANGQRITLSLERLDLASKLIIRTTPAVAKAAYLLAEAPRPQGVWLAGEVALQRDGVAVGHAAWNPAADEVMRLPFGQDELVKVEGTRHTESASKVGFTGSRAEERVNTRYTVTNGHKHTINVEVLEASPVSVTDEVKVAVTYLPLPTERNWSHLEGVVAWKSTLAPAQALQLNADYVVNYPKDAQVTGLED